MLKSNCSECGRNWNQVKHSARGLCRGCARKMQYKEKKKSVRWARDFDYCQNPFCINTKNKITTQPHNAKGLCSSCFSAKQRSDTRSHSLQVEARRRQNPEVCRASSKKHWEANLEQEHERRRQWRKDNPEKSRQGNRRRRARFAQIKGDFTLEEWLTCVAEHNFQCYHCHYDFAEDNIPTADHLIPLSKEGSTNYISNIGPLCSKCNSKKGAKPLKEFDPEYFKKRFPDGIASSQY